MAQSSRTDISVVSITFNGLDDTRKMIDSLKKVIKSVSLEIIIVDNASKQNEAEIIAREYDDVVAIRSEKNLGFSGGNNLGIAKAAGRYVMLLNNDTYIEEDGLGKLVALLDASPKIGAASPKIKFAKEPHLIQFAGFTPLSSITLRNSLVGYMEEDNGQYDTPREIPYAHGAAMIVRREAIRDAGMMPDEYFLYYEEIDWSISIRESGYEIWYEPACTIFHRDSQAGVSKVADHVTYYLTRNRLLLAWRKTTGTQRWGSIAYQLGVANPKNVAVSLIKGRPKTALTTVKACYGFCTMKKGGRK